MSNPTDTNQASELYELCKEVYRRTKWDDYCEYWSFGGEYTVNKDSMTSIEVQTAIIPLYTSDYLLEKLPDPSVHKLTDNWRAFGGEQDTVATAIADTPLKALLKLTIALHDSGALK